MSLAIEVDEIIAVLLSDGEWHAIKEATFTIDTYEYLGGKDSQGNPAVLLGSATEPPLPATGAGWYGVDGYRYACPLNAVLAVKMRVKPGYAWTGM